MGDIMDTIFGEFDNIRSQEFIVKDEIRKNECSHCGKDDVCLLDGNLTCKSCHTLNSQHLDSSAEWRTFLDSYIFAKDKTRCGAPVSDLLPQTCFTSQIGYTGLFENKDILEIRKYHFWSSLSYSERSTMKIFDLLTLTSSNHGLPKVVIELAKVLFNNVNKNKAEIMRGVNKIGIVASSIYFACKREGVPRSCKEVAEMFNIDSNVVNKGCRLFKDKFPDVDIDSEPSQASDFVGRFCGRLNLDNEKTSEVMQEVRKHEKQQKFMPMSLVSGCIFICSKKWDVDISRSDIAKCCHVSVVTVSKVYKELGQS